MTKYTKLPDVFLYGREQLNHQVGAKLPIVTGTDNEIVGYAILKEDINKDFDVLFDIFLEDRFLDSAKTLYIALSFILNSSDLSISQRCLRLYSSTQVDRYKMHHMAKNISDLITDLKL